MSDLPIKISLFGNEIKENVCQMQLCYESNFRVRGIRKISNVKVVRDNLKLYKII